MHIGDCYRDFPLRPACCRYPVVSRPRHDFLLNTELELSLITDYITLSTRVVSESDVFSELVPPLQLSFSSTNFFELLECYIEFVWNVVIYDFDKRGEFDKDVEVPKSFLIPKFNIFKMFLH
jgi:hypothetical protein